MGRGQRAGVVLLSSTRALSCISNVPVLVWPKQFLCNSEICSIWIFHIFANYHFFKKGFLYTYGSENTSSRNSRYEMESQRSLGVEFSLWLLDHVGTRHAASLLWLSVCEEFV